MTEKHKINTTNTSKTFSGRHFGALFLLCIQAAQVYARGTSYCASDSCRKNSVWLVFWLGFVAIFFIVYGRQPVSKSPRSSFFAKWFVFSILAMFGALVVQAEILNLRNGWGMLIVALTGYGVFWYGISLPLKNSNKRL